MTDALPAWFTDAKLGIFIHWGIFSVTAFAPRGQTITELMKARPDDAWGHLPYTEWYPNSLCFADSEVSRVNRERHGGRPYESFREDFDRASEAFDANDWADLFAEAGARYAVFVTKHHDGYCLWPSAVENPHKPGWHSKRDFVGELATAVKAKGLTFGTYYSGGMDWTFRHIPIDTFGAMMANVPFEDDYRAYALAQYRELIARTGTDVLWNDIAYPDEGDRDQLFAEFKAANPNGVVNDRWNAKRRTFEKMRDPVARAATDAFIKQRWQSGEGELMGTDNGMGDFRTPEYSDQLEFDRAWEACRGMDMSFGFNAEARPEDYMSAEELIRSFVEIVAHGGNLLLNMGPRADGSVPEIQQTLLRTLGAWLKVNGGAIYGTRRTARPRGIASDGTPYRLTEKDGTLYVHLMQRPRGRLSLPTVTGARSARRLDGGGVTIQGGPETALIIDRPFGDEPVHVIALPGARVTDA